MFDLAFHQIDKPVEEERGVLGTAASLGVELNGESGHIVVGDTLAGSVVAVHKAYLGVFGNAVIDDRVAVVLRCDEYPVGLDLFCGLVCAAVTVVELLGSGTLRESQKL